MAILSKTLEKRVAELERRLHVDEIRFDIELRFVGTEPRPGAAVIRPHGDLAAPATYTRTITVPDFLDSD